MPRTTQAVGCIAISERAGVLLRYYRLFPQGWEWLEDTARTTHWFSPIVRSPTDTDLSIYLILENRRHVHTRRDAPTEVGYGVTVRFAPVCGSPTRRTHKSPSGSNRIGTLALRGVLRAAVGSGREEWRTEAMVNGKLAGEPGRTPAD